MGHDHQLGGFPEHRRPHVLSAEQPPLALLVLDRQRACTQRVSAALHHTGKGTIRIPHHGLRTLPARRRGQHVPALPRRVAQLHARPRNWMGRILDRIPRQTHRLLDGKQFLYARKADLQRRHPQRNRPALPAGHPRRHRTEVGIPAGTLRHRQLPLGAGLFLRQELRLRNFRSDRPDRPCKDPDR